MITKENIDRLAGNGSNVLDSAGNKIGSIGQLYLDDRTEDPSWATVKTGLFGTSESFVPLAEATVDGDDIRVPYTKDQVKDAPRVDPDGHLSETEEDRLFEHYGLGANGAYTGTSGTAGVGTGVGADSYTGTTGTDAGTRTVGTGDYDDATGSRGAVGHDTSGPTTDDAMTRSEEQLHVGTESRETGRARLRKYIVTENVTQTVPVSREEVRVEREPITDANAGDALDGPDLSEEEHEVVLREERPVVEKETVPVERVRLDKETVTDQETVSEEVRKEQIETDGDDNGRLR
ncbi:PRC and DUF2382 domain-containing protein [Arthrobacter sp. VKM Ac-2550]|uniref:PRC and DUF2382 domain-containing protein n=1 Tax=Crystallibacter permensis TaxID=1938888 RepID=UPI002227CB2B|nr:PRC and DUF2382 domain-containing protein [Arthrobacter sp. VKM Ac-2550]MCW2134235.1 conserved domain-containing protein [Arthrobacter sp. VKM Ac-2550]